MYRGYAMKHPLLDAIKAKPELAATALAMAIETVIEKTGDSAYSALSGAEVLEVALSHSLATLVDGGLVGIVHTFNSLGNR